MKTVLLFIDWFLPAYKAGGPVRSCANITEHLNDEFHFKIITRNTEYCENEPLTNINSNTWNSRGKNIEVYYLSSQNINYSSLKQLINTTSFDVVYINGIYSFYFSILPLILLRNSLKPCVLSARGMLSAHALGVKSVKKKLFLFLANTIHLYKKVCFHATNEKESEDIKTCIKGAKVKIAPNLPTKREHTPLQILDKQSNSLRLVSIARISPEKNTLYALECLKNVKSNIEFDLYGTIYNQAYWVDCLKLIESLPTNIKVSYKGAVESNLVEPTLKQYHFLFSATRGENFGHTILESFLAGRPVIISNTTPWKDLEAKNVGFDIPLTSTITFESIIEKCATMSNTEYQKMMESAFEYGRQIYENQEVIIQTKQLFN